MNRLIPALLATMLFSIPFSSMAREAPQHTEDLGTADDMDSMYAGTTKGNKLRPSGEPQATDVGGGD